MFVLLSPVCNGMTRLFYQHLILLLQELHAFIYGIYFTFSYLSN